jgi:hypothetical protein
MLKVIGGLAASALLLVGSGVDAFAAGETAFISREFDLWPSAAALGGTAVSSADPLVALWVNPAGLVDGPGQAGAMHSEWIADTRSEQLAAALGKLASIHWGLSAHLVTTEDIPLRPLQGGVPVPLSQPLGTFEARDFALGLSGAFEPAKRWAVGFSLRYLAQKVYVDEASTLGFDLGLAWRHSPRLRLAAAVSNLGPSLDWGTGAQVPLPRSLRAGGTIDPVRTVSLSADLWLQRDRSARGGVGVEWRPAPVLAVRTGYLAGSDSQNLTVGFGLNWRGVGLDYALAPMSNDLGTTHRLALRIVPSRFR